MYLKLFHLFKATILQLETELKKQAEIDEQIETLHAQVFNYFLHF